MPLTHNIFLREVFLPEVTVRLIQEDLDLSREESIEVLHQSHKFGNLLHPTDDDSPHVEDAARCAMELSARKESVHRLWRSSGTTLALEEWVVEQRALEEELDVKKEEMDLELDEFVSENLPTSSLPSHGTGAREDPIDLS